MPDDREQRFEQALARHLANASPDSGSGCPDAEILAAYHERALSIDEMSRWKEHIVSCDRCRESLALVEQTENLAAEEWERHKLQPAELAAAAAARAMSAGVQSTAEPRPSAAKTAEMSLPTSKLRLRAQWRWVVPMGAIAAGIIVVIGVREIRTQRARQAYETQVADRRLNMPQLPIPQAERRDSLKEEESPSARLDKVTPPQKKAAAPSPAALSPRARSSSAAPVVLPNSADDQLAVGNRKQPAGVAGIVAGSQPSPSAYAAKSQAAEAAPPASSSPAAALADSNRVVREKEQTVNPTQPSAETAQIQSAAVLDSTSSQLEVGGLSNPTGLLLVAAANRRYIVAPGEVRAWRLGDAGKIERTTDRGKTWKPENSGVTADLTAGSATSDKVCWVVGKAGTLLLTTDAGKHWRLISSPIPDDLGGVHATDATHASIWNVTNRVSYETSDGGLTWLRTADE